MKSGWSRKQSRVDLVGIRWVDEITRLESRGLISLESLGVGDDGGLIDFLER